MFSSKWALTIVFCASFLTAQAGQIIGGGMVGPPSSAGGAITQIDPLIVALPNTANGTATAPFTTSAPLLVN